MLRCNETGFEVLIILLQAFPPRARPQVAAGGTDAGARFTATVAAPGTALLLPAEARALASGPWQSLNELAIEVENGGAVIRGVVALDGLSTALQSLLASCPSR